MLRPVRGSLFALLATAAAVAFTVGAGETRTRFHSPDPIAIIAPAQHAAPAAPAHHADPPQPALSSLPAAPSGSFFTILVAPPSLVFTPRVPSYLRHAALLL